MTEVSLYLNIYVTIVEFNKSIIASRSMNQEQVCKLIMA